MTLEPLLPACDRTPAAKLPFESGRDDEPSTTLVEALASVDGADPVALEPLYGVVDLEVLDRLFAHRATSTASGPAVTCLAVGDRNVCIGDDGVVCVCNADDPADRPF